MTELEMRREIFYALTEVRDENGRPVLESIEAAQELARGVFHSLNGKGLLDVDRSSDE